MKLGFLCTTVLLSTCITDFTLSAEKESAAPEWLGDYSQAKLIAKKTDKPLFVVFR